MNLLKRMLFGICPMCSAGMCDLCTGCNCNHPNK